MPSDRWQLIKSLVDAALDMDPGERLLFLERSCPDASTRREVESLLEHEGDAFPESIRVETGDGAASPTVAAVGVGSGSLGSARSGRRPSAGSSRRPGSGVVEIGSRLDHFEFKGALGSGGMGDVYRALDTKLRREVAIKLLPEEMAHDPERLARLRREAQVLASLNHPGIASIYDLGEHEGQHYLVLELVEGETLAERLERGAMPVPVALQVGLQIAQALEAAHGAGVVHRDLKPSNVKITPEFKVVVLDFGLAKVTAPADGDSGPDLSMSPTIMASATRAGVILGTAGYMSPEQARGRPVDKRSDVWGLGCLLFEMLTGRRTFEGHSVTDLLAAIVKDEPDWSALPPSLPPTAFALLRRCLQKSRSRRLHDIADARIELQEAIEEPEALALSGPATGRGLGRALPLRHALTLAGTLATIAAAVGAWAAAPAPPAPRTPVRARVELTEVIDRSMGSPVVLSPDGARMAYVAQAGKETTVWVRRLDQEQGTRLGNGGAPFFSPDGEWVAFWRGSRDEGTTEGVAGELVRVPVGGGTPQLIVAIDDRSLGVRGAHWSDVATIVFGTMAGGLYRVSPEGGEPEALTTPVDEYPPPFRPSHRWPHVLPGGRAVLFTAAPSTGTYDDATIELLDLETGARRVLVSGGTAARYVSTGHLLYQNRRSLYAIPFALADLQPTGPPVTVLEGLSEWTANGSSYYSVSDGGTLAYMSGDHAVYPVLRVDRRGIREEISTIPPGAYMQPRLSPDGTRLAVNDWAEGRDDIWVFDLVRGGTARITSYAGFDAYPTWSPDGETIAFTSERNFRGGAYDMYTKRSDGSGPARAITERGRERRVNGRFPQFTQDWTAAGLAIVDVRGGANIALIQPGEEAEPVFVADEPSEWEMSPAISPNGRWMAYQSNRSGRFEVYVRPVPPGEGLWTISTEGGAFPRWSGDGSELFFRTDEGIMVAEVEPGRDTFVHRRPRYLFQGAFLGTTAGTIRAGFVCDSCWDYDVAPDGQSFVMFPATDDRLGEVLIVIDWFEELRRLAPTPE